MNIPLFPQSRPFTLDDKPVIDEFLKKYPPLISEMTFTNLFAWQDAYRFELAVLEGCLLVVSKKDQNHINIFDPVGSEEEKKRAVIMALSRDNVKFIRISEDTVNSLKDEKIFKINEDRDNFDYVYLSKDLIELKGADFDAKRNFLKRFKDSYKFEYKEITSQNVEVCLAFEEEWCLARDCYRTEGLMCEKLAVEKMLKNFKHLSIKGGMIEINGKVEAVSLGEPLNQDTFVVHVEKANGDYVGIYQAINQLFCENEAKGFIYINREQDLGVSGLRKAKGSYHPHHYIKKFSVERV
ncbi:MAG TPA: phosphatidylglycerol lysyltransferase domain-containing protein [Candidatus Omnitrophota bacterium]|nr:phosphatidylglycerol lysyltransferase domain-containing protein [Candidatus Omnitrophota bacterium]